MGMGLDSTCICLGRLRIEGGSVCFILLRLFLLVVGERRPLLYVIDINEKQAIKKPPF